MNTSRLGKGLDALISKTTRSGGASVVDIPLDQIQANPDQPRQVFREGALQGLAASIQTNGVLQPVIVQSVADGYRLIAGERRVRASRLAGRETVPALILQAEGVSGLEIALVENIQRENLGPLEEAAAFEALLARTGKTHDELAERLGKSRAAVSNAIRLLDLPDKVKAAMKRGELSAGQARALLGAKSKQQMERLADQAIKHRLSVREVEQRVRTARPASKKTSSRTTSLPEYRRYEEDLMKKFGTKVRIQGADKGEVVFSFYSKKDRDRLLDALITAGRSLEAGA